LAELLDMLAGDVPFELRSTPNGVQGTLRPYQARGFSWLHFLMRWGLGACLADDMGLGKTVQTLALLQQEREERMRAGDSGPNLLVCPTSVISNWQREAARFVPDLPVLVHHGPDRLQGAAFAKEARRNALVITSYA